MTRAIANAGRGIYDAVARADSVSPVELHAEDIVQVRVFDDRRQPLKAVGLRG